MIYNSKPDSIIITDMMIEWPPEHEELEEVKLGKDKIWENFNGEGDDPPTHMPPWTSPPDKRDIKAFDSKKLEFRFREEVGAAVVNDYHLVITFEIMGTGQFCTMSAP